MRKLASLIPGGLLLVGLSISCTSQRNVVESSIVETELSTGDYSKNVQSVFDAKCVSCHGGSSPAAGLGLESWEQLIKGSDHGEAIIAFDPEYSVLVEMATKLQPNPHLGDATNPLSTSEIAVIRSWISSGAKNDDGSSPFEEISKPLYVANQGAARVAVIDTDANVVARTVDLQSLGFSSTSKPHHAVAEKDGSAWYLSMIGESKVLKFDRNNKLIASTDFEKPGMMAMHPNDGTIVVGRSMMAVSPPTRVGIIERESMELDEWDVFFPRPHALAIAPAGDRLFAASLAENSMIAIDIKSGVNKLNIMGGPVHTLVQFAVAPGGEIMVAGGQVSGKLLVFDISNSLDVTLVDSIKVNAAPWHPVFSPDGKRVYFGNKMANTITVVDMENRNVEAVIDGNGISQPHGIALSEDGKTLYVSNANLKGAYKSRHNFGDNEMVGTITVIDTETLSIKKVIEVEQYASGISPLFTP